MGGEFGKFESGYGLKTLGWAAHLLASLPAGL